MSDMRSLRPEMFVQNNGAANGNPVNLRFWALVAEDFESHGREWFSQGFWAVFWHRFGNWRMGLRWKLLRAPMTVVYRVMFKLTEWICGIHLPYTVRLGRRPRLEHFGGMILVPHAIGDDVIIRQNTTMGVARLSDLQGRPVIGDGVEIGAGAVLVGSIHVGNGAVIGANTVVVRDVPAAARVGGVPARLLP